MNPSYQFNPYMLPMLASAAFSIVLGIYGWRRRVVPGALPFALVMALDVLWATGAALVMGGAMIFKFGGGEMASAKRASLATSNANGWSVTRQVSIKSSTEIERLGSHCADAPDSSAP